MDAACAASWAAKIQIGKDQLVREEYEILVLKELFESEFGVALMLKNGAALRLAYHSARFAENLDFNLIGGLDEGKFKAFLKKIVVRYPGLTEVNFSKSYHAFQARLKIKIDHLPRPLYLRLTIYKHAKAWAREDYQDRLITSETTPLTVLARVASLAVIVAETKAALQTKRSARDVYDHWFLSQLLQQGAKADFSGFDKTQAKAELHKLLARPYWPLMDSWLE